MARRAQRVDQQHVYSCPSRAWKSRCAPRTAIAKPRKSSTVYQLCTDTSVATGFSWLRKQNEHKHPTAPLAFGMRACESYTRCLGSTSSPIYLRLWVGMWKAGASRMEKQQHQRLSACSNQTFAITCSYSCAISHQ